MVYPLKRSLILLGACLALSDYFLVFNDFPHAFPVSISLSYLQIFYTQITLPLLAGSASHGGLILPLSLILVCLAYWFFLLLALIQVGLGIWSLKHSSRRTRKWSIALATGGFVLMLLFFVGVLLFLANFSLTFRLEGVPPHVSTWEILQKAFTPSFLWSIFGAVSQVLWLPALGLLLVLILNWFTRPQEKLQEQNSEAQYIVADTRERTEDA